jgi:hypothetical protein
VFRQVVRPGKGMLAKLALKLLFALKRKEKGLKFQNFNKTTSTLHVKNVGNMDNLEISSTDKRP